MAPGPIASTEEKGNETQTSNLEHENTQAAPCNGTRSYIYVIQSRDKRPAPKQAPRGCFDHLGNFPANGCKEQDRDDQAWLPFLEALGLQRSIFPAIKIDGIKPQRGTPTSWNYLNYVLIAVSPEGKLEGRVMYNLALAWCPSLKANNSSFRHCLAKCDEFMSNKPYHRLAAVNEEKRSPTISGASRSPTSSSPSASESTKHSPRKRSSPESPETGYSTHGSLEKDASPSPTKPCTRASKRLRTDSGSGSRVNSEQVLQASDPKGKSKPVKPAMRLVKCSQAGARATVNKAAVPMCSSISDTTEDAAERQALTDKIVMLRHLEVHLDLWIRSGNGVDRAVWGTSRHPKEMYEQVIVDLEDARYNLNRFPRGQYLARHGLAAYQARYPSEERSLPNGRTPLPTVD